MAAFIIFCGTKFSGHTETHRPQRMQAVGSISATWSLVRQVIAEEVLATGTSKVNIAIPGKPMTIGLALTDYDRLMADAPGTPNLHEVFDHQIGDPFSYPTCPDDITRKAGKVEILWGENRWDDWMPIGSGGSVIRDITLTESMAKRASFSYSMETELVVSAGCAKAGVGFGYNNTNETTHEETTNFSVSGCVPGLAPGDNNPNRPYFQWNLCWYKYTLAGQTFPVVNYIVKPRSARSTAPKGI